MLEKSKSAKLSPTPTPNFSAIRYQKLLNMNKNKSSHIAFTQLPYSYFKFLLENVLKIVSSRPKPNYCELCCISSDNPSTRMPILLLLLLQQETATHAYIYIYTTILPLKLERTILTTSYGYNYGVCILEY